MRAGKKGRESCGAIKSSDTVSRVCVSIRGQLCGENKGNARKGRP